MSRAKFSKELFFSNYPYLEDFPRILCSIVGAYLCIFTSEKAFSQAPLIIFLVGCVFALLGLNGIKFSGVNISSKGIALECYKDLDQPNPIPAETLPKREDESGQEPGLVPIYLTQNIKSSIAGIATTASGETTRPDQIEKIYAISGNVDNVLITTSNQRIIELDFKADSGISSTVVP
jgi:hypothetical protein